MNKTIYKMMSVSVTLALILGFYTNAGASSKFAPQMAASTYFVSATGSDANNCTQQATPCKSFNKAMNLAQAGDVIHIIGTIPSIVVTKSGITIEGGTVDGIANKSANSPALGINANNVTIRNVEIINGWSYGLRTGANHGDGLVLDNVNIHNNVLENKIGNRCNTTSTNGWGSGFRAYYSSNIVVKNSRIYDNCGEGFSSVLSKGVTGINLEIYDNFSVNVYPDQSQNFTVTDSVISCIKPEYQRMTLSASLLLGAESYSGITTNLLDGVTFERNKIYNCKGVYAYSETGNSWKNIRIVDNEFYNVPPPVIVSISGTNIITSPNVIASIPSGATPTWTNTPSSTSTTLAPVFIPTSTLSLPTPTTSPIPTSPTLTQGPTVPTATLIMTGAPVSTNTPMPTFTPLPNVSSVITAAMPQSLIVGESSLVTVSLNNVPTDGYSSTEFTCTYTPGLIEVSNIVIAGLFGTDSVSALNDPQNGSFIVAIAGSNGKKATINDTAFTFNVSGLQAGQTIIDCKARVSKGDGILENILSIPDTLTILENSPTATPIAAPLLTGQVLATKLVTIRLFNLDASLAATTTANADGTFSLTAPAGIYTIIASADGYLDSQGSATLVDGVNTIMPVVSLPAGDIDGNDTIDQFDAMTLGMSYNVTAPIAAELNNDGITNILDLEMLAENYRKSGALAWQ